MDLYSHIVNLTFFFGPADLSILIISTNPFLVLGVSGGMILFLLHFPYNFCKQTMTTSNQDFENLKRKAGAQKEITSQTD